jgi:hypothetical protein
VNHRSICLKRIEHFPFVLSLSKHSYRFDRQKTRRLGNRHSLNFQFVAGYSSSEIRV